jgi:hypothetical protein
LFSSARGSIDVRAAFAGGCADVAARTATELPPANAAQQAIDRKTAFAISPPALD